MGLVAGVGDLIASGVGLLGLDAGTAAALTTGIEGAGIGALGGGAVDAVTGKPILPGALGGALTGGLIGGAGPLIGGVLGDATGGALGTTAGDIVAGLGGGALGAGVTGANPLTGALEGGLAGGVTGLASGAVGGSGGGATATTGVGTGTSAAGSAAPASASPGGGGFLSSLFGGSGGGGVGGLPSSPISPTVASDASNAATYGATSEFASNPGAAAASGGGGGLLSNLFGGSGGSGGSFLKNYGGPLVAATGLGLDALRGTTPLPNQNALQGEAGQLASQGQQLQSYLQTGNLPPGVQQSLTAAADSAKAAIRSQYAQMGGDTSAMQQDLAHVDQVTATQGATIATQLLQEGVSETGLSEQIYSQLLNLSLSQNQQLGQGIGNLASAIAGGSRPVILQQQATNA